MLTKAYIVAGALAASALGNPLSTRPGYEAGFCRTAPFSDEKRQQDREIMASVRANAAVMSASEFNVTVPTYFHVVSKSKLEEEGYLSRETLLAQLKQLNSDYATTGFQFELKDIDWTVNARWAADQDTSTMRRKLRKGNYGTLNLYFQDSFVGGYCHFPEDTESGSDIYWNDGCYISYKTVPGSSDNDTFNKGKVVSHEVGHWSNLLHTFQGGCDGEGDEVDDTPAETHDGGAQGCPVGQDTCPELPGLDPIHNHMTYTDDGCRTEFTSGQISRMQTAWTAYRDGK